VTTTVVSGERGVRTGSRAAELFVPRDGKVNQGIQGPVRRIKRAAEATRREPTLTNPRAHPASLRRGGAGARTGRGRHRAIGVPAGHTKALQIRTGSDRNVLAPNLVG
jgi:hypothetical protein